MIHFRNSLKMSYDRDENRYDYSDDYESGSKDNSMSGNDDRCDDDDYLVGCRHCKSDVLKSNYDKHLHNIHECPHCRNFMPKESIKRHVEEKHMKKCPRCHVMVFETKMNQHISSHDSNQPIGMIQLSD